MARFTFDKCCFCIELKTGCLIIGYLQLIGAIIGTVVLIYALTIGGLLTSVRFPENKSSSSDFSFSRNDDYGNDYGHGYGDRIFEDGSIQEAMKAAGVIIMVVSGIMLVFVVIGLAFVITLLVGLHQGKSGHIKAYLIYGIIFFVLSIIMWFGGFAQKPVNVSNVVGNLFNIFLNLYFLMVIRSYYYELNDTSKIPSAMYNAAPPELLSTQKGPAV